MNENERYSLKETKTMKKGKVERKEKALKIVEK